MRQREKQDRVLEDILDEVLSFNYRSLRTLRDIFLKPGEVAQAFATGDRERYTPTMRVWFGVITWMFLLSIVWGGWGDVIWRLSDSAAPFFNFIRDTGRNEDAVRDAISTMGAILYVPFAALFVIPGAFVLARLNRSLTLVQSIQCYFIPVTAWSVSTMIMLTLGSFWQPANDLAFIPNFTIYMLTGVPVLKAAFAKTWRGAVVKTLLMLLTVFLLTFLARFCTFAASIVYALVTVPGS